MTFTVVLLIFYKKETGGKQPKCLAVFNYRYYDKSYNRMLCKY